MQNLILKKSPKGRLLNMYLFERKTTDYQGKSQLDTTKHRFEAWVAIPKNDPGFAEYWQQVTNAAAVDFAATQAHLQPTFSWKITDGDKLKADGTKHYNENCHGHWLLSYSSNFDVEVYNAQNQPITKLHNAVKAGDYVEIYGNFKGNASDAKPGIFLNLNKVRVIGIGDAIISGPSAAQAFGDPTAPVAPAMPLAAPVAPAMPLAAPAMPGVPVAAPVAPGMPVAAPVAPLTVGVGATVAPATLPPSYDGYTVAPVTAPVGPNAPDMPNGLPGGDGIPH